jgi:hypothetical protein
MIAGHRKRAYFLSHRIDQECEYHEYRTPMLHGRCGEPWTGAGCAAAIQYAATPSAPIRIHRPSPFPLPDGRSALAGHMVRQKAVGEVDVARFNLRPHVRSQRCRSSAETPTSRSLQTTRRHSDRKAATLSASRADLVSSLAWYVLDE